MSGLVQLEQQVREQNRASQLEQNQQALETQGQQRATDLAPIIKGLGLGGGGQALGQAVGSGDAGAAGVGLNLLEQLLQTRSPAFAPQQEANQLGLQQARSSLTGSDLSNTGRSLQNDILRAQRDALQIPLDQEQAAFAQFSEQTQPGFIPVNLGNGDFRVRPQVGSKPWQDATAAFRPLVETRDNLDSLLRLFDEVGSENIGPNVGTLNLLRGRILAAEAQAQELGTLQPGDLPRLEEMLPPLTGLGSKRLTNERLIAPYREAKRLLERKLEATTASDGELWFLQIPKSTGALPAGFIEGIPEQIREVSRGTLGTSTFESFR